MDFLKKEWKAVLFILWLTGISVFLFQMNSKVNQLQKQNTKLISTIDTVESIVLGTDKELADTGRRVDDIGANVSFIVQKVRKR